MLRIRQVWEAPYQFPIHLVAHILQEVLPEPVNLGQDLCVAIFGLQLVFECVLEVETAVAVLHVGVVLAVQGGGLLVEVDWLPINRRRLIMRLHMSIRPRRHFFLSILPHLENIWLKQNLNLHLFQLVCLAVPILLLLNACDASLFRCGGRDHL